jgi:uncharacterized SAM-binding protein YcdF (DUF218 family)
MTNDEQRRRNNKSMFLFFSKLLPLFFYPLGLACLLLLVALLVWWKRSRWTPLPVFLGLAVLLLASNGWVSSSLARSLEWQNIPEGELPSAEAIVVLGGSLKPAWFPRPMVDVAEGGDRVFYAAQLYRENKAPLIITAGGRIDWQGSGGSEAADITKLLTFIGVNPSDITQESNSLNTHQNAVNVRQILERRNLDRVLLVTSAIHMPRSLLVFQSQGIEAVPAPTDFLIAEPDLEQLDRTPQATLLNLLPSVDRLALTTRAIKEYVGIVVYWLRGWI